MTRPRGRVPRPSASLSLAEARRTALAAQGFCDRRPARPSARTLDRVLDRTQVLQIDSVNVLQRAHYVPVFSRAGRYDVELLHRAAGRAPRRLVEYWAHEAAYLPVSLWPLMRHRMDEASARAWGGPRAVARDRPDLLTWVLEEVRGRGPVSARDIEGDLAAVRTRDAWGWNWSETKQALEYLFWAGEVTVARRNAQFERLYDVPERVLPPEVLATPVPDPDDARRELVRRAARAHGVATERSLRDYFRMGVAETRAALDDLLDSGEVEPVAVEGWRAAAYLHRDARVPRRVEACTLLSPFDPVVWERQRAEALYGFRYRIEIYVPQAQRVHGYYVLPFLLGDRLVARVDLKADRPAAALRVQAAYAEEHAPPGTAERLADALRELGTWLGLDAVTVADRGDLAPALGAVLGSAPGAARGAPGSASAPGAAV